MSNVIFLGKDMKFLKISLNPAIVYALSLRGWQLVAGPITLFFIAHFFSATQQGFFYTFNSILLLQIFFEMGLSYVLIQFISHEFAYLRWGQFGSVKGGQKITRFKALVRKAFHWYAVAAILFALIVIPVGFGFLNLKDTGYLNFHWRLPWLLLVLATAINLMWAPLLAVVEGSGKVREVSHLRFWQTIVATLVSWLVILGGGGLLAAATIASTNALFTFWWLYSKKPVLLRLVFARKRWRSVADKKVFCWSQEIWPMQWRIAISWMAGYFINQIFVPILFYYQTPTMAGQMGMSLSLSTMIVFIGQAWLSAKAPFLGRLVAQKDWLALDRVYYQLVWQSSLMVLVASVALITVAYFGQGFSLFQRLLPVKQLTFLCFSALLTHAINCLAQYLRSHKREPFMGLSVVGALLVACCAWYFGRSSGSLGIVVAVLVINLIYGLPSALWLWFKCRRAWQKA